VFADLFAIARWKTASCRIADFHRGQKKGLPLTRRSRIRPASRRLDLRRACRRPATESTSKKARAKGGWGRARGGLCRNNGADVDLKLKQRGVRGLDAIIGGHNHDRLPARPVAGSGKTTGDETPALNGKFPRRVGTSSRKPEGVDRIPVTSCCFPSFPISFNPDSRCRRNPKNNIESFPAAPDKEGKLEGGSLPPNNPPNPPTPPTPTPTTPPPPTPSHTKPPQTTKHPPPLLCFGVGLQPLVFIAVTNEGPALFADATSNGSFAS